MNRKWYRTYIRNPLHCLNQICLMSKYILHILRCCIRYISKCSKRSNIIECPAIKITYITRMRSTFNNTSRSILHTLRYSKSISKIIRASAWNISNRRSVLRFHCKQCINSLIKRTVTSAAYNNIIRRTIANNIFISVSWRLCRVYRKVISSA